MGRIKNIFKNRQWARKYVLTILGLFFLISLTYSQENNGEIKVIAKLIASGRGDKIHIASYEVIKVLKGELTNDTIKVGYYFYKEFSNQPDTALLSLTTYTGTNKIKDYYIFPDYDAKRGIEKVIISTINFDYWEGCETGKGDCKPLNFVRGSKNEKWILTMPCGGTETSVTLTVAGKNKPIRETRISQSECPPVFELTDLKDGKYFANMLSCGLGGQIEINLMTKEK